jgi:hypothetical protein
MNNEIELKIKEVSQETGLSEEYIKNAIQNVSIAFKQISCLVRKYLNNVARVIKSANEEIRINMYIAMNTDDKTLKHLVYMRNRVKTKRLYKKYDKKIKQYVRNKCSL